MIYFIQNSSKIMFHLNFFKNLYIPSNNFSIIDKSLPKLDTGLIVRNCYIPTNILPNFLYMFSKILSLIQKFLSFRDKFWSNIVPFFYIVFFRQYIKNSTIEWQNRVNMLFVWEIKKILVKDLAQKLFYSRKKNFVINHIFNRYSIKTSKKRKKKK